MTKINLAQLTIKKAHQLLQEGKISARELLAFYLENIKRKDKEIHAYLEIFDDAFEKSEEVDKKIKRGDEVSVLAGIPFAVKDLILIKGKKCSAGSKMLENFVAPYDATVIKKLKKCDAVFIGRTNMDEFAMGSSTERSAFGPTRNPYDLERVPGGSSGGSAAAVAAQECLAALGSDTGGSIRQPAAFCGVVGLKPTYGAVSRYGLIAMASSLDQIGPFAKTVEDAKIIFNAIKGFDPKDSTSVDYKGERRDKKIKKIGIAKEFFSLNGNNEGIDKNLVLKIKKAIEFFENEGFELKEISINSLKYALAVYYILMPAEVSSNLARFDGIRYGFSKEAGDLWGQYFETRKYGFGDEVRRRILLGTYVLSAGYYDAYYARAQQVRALIRNDFKKAFEEVDVILSPTTPTPAFKIGEKIDDPIKMYFADIFTVVVNLVGIPAISIPAGLIEYEGKNLPVGIQLMAPWFEEEKLFYLGEIFEKKFNN